MLLHRAVTGLGAGLGSSAVSVPSPERCYEWSLCFIDNLTGVVESLTSTLAAGGIWYMYLSLHHEMLGMALRFYRQPNWSYLCEVAYFCPCCRWNVEYVPQPAPCKVP